MNATNPMHREVLRLLEAAEACVAELREAAVARDADKLQQASVRLQHGCVALTQMLRAMPRSASEPGVHERARRIVAMLGTCQDVLHRQGAATVRALGILVPAAPSPRNAPTYGAAGRSAYGRAGGFGSVGRSSGEFRAAVA
ncbi:hypothetical protein [Candidatus Symbiobacter mobilis]|uniref:Flagellar protein FlgN n=1 Tax=Candidatus Symbiobacter mobilis CR TaxID=946483 RepID=U5N7Q4_9BURK|nr:hypothetical protein [Candidatus Symbiobacter mobilis]AGX87402.1 hypothetical protein Cenrod_1312 [Candidatus Symbiobacter mobilis CR]